MMRTAAVAGGFVAASAAARAFSDRRTISCRSSANMNAFRHGRIRGFFNHQSSCAAVPLRLWRTALAEEEEKDRANAEEEKNEVEEESVPAVPRYDFVIVGLGTAGFAALQELIAFRPDAKILVVAKEDELAYLRPPLSKDLWMKPVAAESGDGSASSTAAPLRFRDWNGNESSVFQSGSGAEYSHPNVEVLRGERAIDIDTVRKALLLESNRVVEYGSVLFATGSTPKQLPAYEAVLQAAKAEGADEAAIQQAQRVSERVTTYRTVKDYERLHKIASEADHILVVGGSFLGSELATALSAFSRKQRGGALKVTQVFPEAGLMGLSLPEYLVKYATSRMQSHEGVTVLADTLVKEVRVTNCGHVVVSLDSGKTLSVDHVVCAVGVSPSTELGVLGDLEIDEKNGGIVVNAELEARRDVFVAGDVASYHDLYLGRRRVEHHDHAVESGRAAARNMVGKRELYQHLPMFWGDFTDLGYEAVGTLDNAHRTVGVWDLSALPENELAEEATESDPQDYKRGIVYYLNERDQVVGVLLWNVWGRVDDARKLVMRGEAFPATDDGDDKLQHAISLETESHDPLGDEAGPDANDA